MSRATACAEVITSSAPVGMPSSVRCAATVSGVRRALFVTYASRMPPRRAVASDSTAYAIAFPPAYTTPSRSSSAVSYASARACPLPSGLVLTLRLIRHRSSFDGFPPIIPHAHRTRTMPG